jgi:anaerobic selenocysteine-containing dehydrogenase
VENNQIVKVRGDKDNPGSQGYVCRKGLNIRYHQHHADRLTHPLKKSGESFETISWDQAIDEISQKLRAVVDEYEPRSFALVGGGTLGCPSQGVFAINVLRGMGSQYFYNALGQELTGRYWVDGKTFGNQHLHSSPDYAETDMLLTVGWNPMMSHHLPQARRMLTRFSKNPDKILVVVDPRVSETAKIADIHLPIHPGTDALFYRAMISIIIGEGWHDQAYIEKYVKGFDEIRPLFENFDCKAALDVCELDYEQVKEVCRLFTIHKSSHHSDLGVLMNRHSTLISYLENVLRAVCGRIGIKGGNVFPIGLRSGGKKPSMSPDEREARSWRTVVTDYPAITSLYPPNAMPEEILSDHPDRLRAVIVSGANPLRSFADTTAYENAFKRLDLSVSVEIAMTETAALCDYVLPARSAYESWDGGVRPSFPRVLMHFRPPVVQPEGEQLEAGEIFVKLADRLGLVPEIPDALKAAAGSGDRAEFGRALFEFAVAKPEAARAMPYILSKTLGANLGSGNLAALWGMLSNLPPTFHAIAEREGFTPDAGLGEEIFQAVLDHPEGLVIGSVDPDTWDHFQAIATEDGLIHLDVPEMTEWLEEIEPIQESQKLQEDARDFPLIMSSGRHWDTNANTQMRDPTWNEGKRACTALVHPEDAQQHNFKDGQVVKVTTEAGWVTIEVEVTRTTRQGYVMLPHGFGLVHQGKVYGANANRLAKNTHRDRIAGTPYHRFIRCRMEPE